MVLLKALRDYVSEQNSNVIKEALGKVSGDKQMYGATLLNQNIERKK